MSLSLRGLAGETVIYGATTMLGRLLNWLLMPFYIRLLSPEEYGVVLNLYGFISILLVLFTYGLETGFFRFSRIGNQSSVYKSTLIILAFTSTILILLSYFFAPVFSEINYNGNYKTSILLMGIIVAFDSFLSIPFANLRLNNRPIRFGIIKLISIFLNLFLNIFFLLIVPYLIKNNLLSIYYTELYYKGNGVFFVLLSNAISSIFVIVFFIKEFFTLKGTFDKTLLYRILNYSWPVLIVGITGMLTQNSDKILMPKLLGDKGFESLAVYGANFKIGVLMSLFTQSFRFAFEPFFFKNQDKGVQVYAKIMDYFVFFGVCIFLGVLLFLDVINLLLTKEYLGGNVIIPIVLVAQLLYGIYFNLSLWYKLTDKTYFGAIFGTLGTIITVGLNIILIPKIGLIGGAIALLAGYFIMVILSFILGQKYYPVPYPLKTIFAYIFTGTLLYLTDIFIEIDNLVFSYIFKAFIFVSFVFIFYIIQKKNTIKQLS